MARHILTYIGIVIAVQTAADVGCCPITAVRHIDTAAAAGTLTWPSRESDTVVQYPTGEYIPRMRMRYLPEDVATRFLRRRT